MLIYTKICLFTLKQNNFEYKHRHTHLFQVKRSSINQNTVIPVPQQAITPRYKINSITENPPIYYQAISKAERADRIPNRL